MVSVGAHDEDGHRGCGSARADRKQLFIFSLKDGAGELRQHRVIGTLCTDPGHFVGLEVARASFQSLVARSRSISLPSKDAAGVRVPG